MTPFAGHSDLYKQDLTIKRNAHAGVYPAWRLGTEEQPIKPKERHHEKIRLDRSGNPKNEGCA